MGSYNLVDDFGGPDYSVSPAWVIAVIRFRHAVTFSRVAQRGFSEDGNESVATRGPTLVIEHDCVSLTTQSNKGSHISNLDASLMLGNVNYMTEIRPGDWIFAWMMNDPQKAADVARRVRANQPCNDWDDGLKFMGRVQSVRKKGFVAPMGHKTGRYSVQAVGFREFDTSAFYDPHLALRRDVSDWLGQIGVRLQQFLTKGGADINEAIPTLLDTLFGTGLPASAPGVNLMQKPQLQIATGLTQGTGDAPFAYVVPAEVGNLLDKKSRSKPGGALAYADLLECNIGLHRYTSPVGIDERACFIADGLEYGSGIVRRTGKPLLGKFLPAIPDLTGKTVWTVLAGYLNPAINEMYTCLRVNADMKIVPHLVVRQLPFSTPVIESRYPDDVTPYLELPRWVIHESLVKSWDIGRSDALRFNFVHVYGQSTASQSDFSIKGQLVNNPPVRDSMDIKRSGLRMDQMTVACDVGSTHDMVNGPRRWMEIRSDFLMGQHLSYNGTIVMQGVQAPICEGDNIEWDGVVFHIEGVMHQCVVQPSGQKSFVTSLTLTHGMRADGKERWKRGFDGNIFRNPDEALYPGMFAGDNTQHDPGLTVEGGDAAVKQTTSPDLSQKLPDFNTGREIV